MSNSDASSMKNRPCNFAGKLYVLNMLGTNKTPYKKWEGFIQAYMTYQGELYIRTLETTEELKINFGVWNKKF